MEILKDTPTELEIKVTKEHTFYNLLREYLLSNVDVELVIYSIVHPLRDDAKLYIKTKSGTPKIALKNALKKITTDIKEIEKNYLSSIERKRQS